MNVIPGAMRKILCAMIILALGSAVGQTREVCVTIDDLPVAGPQTPTLRFRQLVTAKLLDALTRHHVPAIGFVNAKKLSTSDAPDSSNMELLTQWLDRGMDLGNHTYSHKDYNTVGFDEFSADVVQGELPLKALLAARGKRLLYFRQPFLHRGPSKEKADSLQAFLLHRGYREAPVTIDNGDWIFATAYYTAYAAADSVQMKKLAGSYIDYMESKLKYYEMQSQRLFGRPMKQILLIHASLLNADTFDALAQMFERNTYAFISLGEALADPAYASADTFFRKGGISWLDRWALTQGKKGEYFKDEPAVPADVMKLANVESE
jgi:peptidoglycan/xylan/chitin deacetylase (PgdA/CDA1 family)